MTDEALVSNFREAFAAAAQAAEKLKNLEKKITEVSSRLRDDGWKRVQVAPSSGAIPLTGWPSGDELHEAIRDFNDKRRRAREAWNEIPAPERISLADPSTFF